MGKWPMGKKKYYDDDGEPLSAADLEEPLHVRSGGMPAFSVGDILALVILLVLSAALLLEGYYSGFKDYSKEIIALFAIVVGFLLGRKT
jgi:hypothetical protein